MDGHYKTFLKTFDKAQRQQAAEWVTLHERGLTDEEKSAFEKWLSKDPSNEACFFEYQVTLAGFEAMDEWKPAYSTSPNPDLLDNKSHVKTKVFVALGGLAAAITIAVSLLTIMQFGTGNAEQVIVKTYQAQSYEKHFLDDGSAFYLQKGSEVAVSYNSSERHIELIKGEAEFVVNHDPRRPFIVSTEVGRVTALGTVFSVFEDAGYWEVFVKEGKVRVAEVKEDSRPDRSSEHYTTELVAGQRIIELLTDEEFSPEVETLVGEALEARLAWKDQIIEMVSVPLSEILLEFKDFSSQTVVISDEELKTMRMTVAIKPDSLYDFIDLLALTAGVEVNDTSPGPIYLTKASN